MDYTKIISLVIILLESISMLICFHISFGKKIRVKVDYIVFLILYVVYFYIKSVYELNVIYNVIAIFILLLWVCYEFKLGIVQSIIRYIISLVMTGIIQSVLIFLFIPATDAYDEMQIALMLVIVGILNTVVFFSIYLFVIRRNDKKYMTNLNKYICVCILLAFIAWISIKIDFEVNKYMNTMLYLLFFISCLLVMIVIIREQRTKLELEKKEIQLSLKKEYDEKYNELLNEVRRKEHDYKNQISALYSTHYVATTLEELVSMQREYGDKMLDDISYNKILTGCSSPIMAGFVYNKCLQAEEKGIKFDVDIKTIREDYLVPMFEIIEILGILLDNAVEYIGNVEKLKKVVKMVIMDSDNRLHIEVANEIENITYSDINQMFKNGYSTKGDNRGIGLSSLKKIVDKYKGDVSVEKDVENNAEWLKFTISFLI